IVRAADEGAKLAQFQRELAGAAGGAKARVRAIFLGREDAAGEEIVERVQNFGNAEVLDLVDIAVEILPEVAEDLLVIELAVGNFVELLFEAGGKAVFDIAREEALEEGGDDAAAIFRVQRFAFEANIVAIDQRRDRGGI